MTEEINPSLYQILAVIVLYNESLETSITYESLYQSIVENAKDGFFFRLVVYDNSPKPQKVITSNPFFSITYKSDISNVGISKAYNFAADIADREGYQYLLLLDQDTLLPKNILPIYLDAISKHQHVKLFAPILKLSNGKPLSPSKFFLHRGFSTRINSGIFPLSKYVPVNSGMLVRLSSFIEAGGYNEKVRLDFSDYQFIERFRKNNEEFFVIDSVCIQQFSNVVSNLSQLITRFEFYCEGAKNASKNNLTDNISYFIIVLMRCFTLTLRTRKLIFFKTFLKKYLIA